MKRTLEDLKPAMMCVLERRYGKDRAAERWTRMERQYAQWLREEGDLGGKANALASNMTLCYAICAFYDALDRDLTKEEYDAFFQDAMGKTFAVLNRLDMNKLEKKGWLMRLAYRYMERYKRRSEKNRGGAWGNTWKVYVEPYGRRRGIAYVLETCPLYEFAQKHGYMDLLPYLCASDQLVARQFHAHLIRHRVLSDGDDCCEYWYVGDQSPEALADTGSK